MRLGKITQVPLREVWKHEALNFTKWLAKPKNLETLSESIGIELSVIDTEYNVGRFNVDIFAKEVNNDRKVIIENQLEKTDHDHLGKLITYASGLGAEIIIWVVKDVLEEHRQAIDWLNENIGEKINFFIIKMEIWKIGDSIPAPKFHVVSKPNNWTKSVKRSMQKYEGESKIKSLQFKFWNGFRDYVLINNLNLRLRKTYAQHWLDIPLGRSNCHISLTVNSQKKEIACEVNIPNSYETFDLFYRNRKEIDELIEGLEWMKLPNKKAKRIKKSTHGDFSDVSKWDEHFKWLSDNVITFQEVFTKY